MTTYRDGQSAPYGLFVSVRPLDVRFVGAAGEELEGIPGAIYKRLPNLVAVALAPVFGGLFVILFPIVVLLVTAAGAWRRIFGKTKAPIEMRTQTGRVRESPAGSVAEDSPPSPKEIPQDSTSAGDE